MKFGKRSFLGAACAGLLALSLVGCGGGGGGGGGSTMTCGKGRGAFVEVQGTAEDKPFSEPEFIALLELAKKGIGELTLLQQKTLEG